MNEILDLKGIVILRVQPGTGAASAGLKGVITARNGSIIPGDIITAIEGKLAALLDDYKVGDKVRLTVIRQGKTR